MASEGASTLLRVVTVGVAGWDATALVVSVVVGRYRHGVARWRVVGFAKPLVRRRRN
jgi:hypothetical protein